jgi:nicotinate-nucleotide adenylyltransferase
MRAIGVFGGTFDPPHIGHLILASEAYAQLSLERVLFVLTPHPPHKTDHPITPVQARLELLQAALGDDPVFEISRVDIDRPAPHFAVETVNLLRVQHPGVSLIYLMGGDSLSDLPTWHTAQDFVQAVDALGVMRRPGRTINLRSLETQLPGLSVKVQFLQSALLEISSSQLRERMAQGRSYRYYLPEAVYQMIQEKRLYNLS